MKTVATILAASLFISTPGWAADCDLQLVNMAPLVVTDNVMTVPVTINGAERRFAFDTAAIASQITADAARDLKLPMGSYTGPTKITGTGAVAFASSPMTHGTGASGLPGASLDADNAVVIYNAAGTPFENFAMAKILQFGAMQNANTPLQITDFPPKGVDGILNGDLFERYDIDLNFHAARFNMFSPDHCRGKILYWRAPGMAALPMLYRAHRIAVHVTVDGKDLTAVIDTGSSRSEMKMADAARLFGIGPGSPGVVPRQAAAPRDRDRYSYDFKTLSFGSVAIGNPHLLLTEDVLVRGANPNVPTGSLIRSKIEGEPSMVIGTDLLKLLHVYIAFGERMLYVTQGLELDEADKAALPVVPVAPFRP